MPSPTSSVLTPFRADLLTLLRTSPTPLTTDEIRDQLGLDKGKQATNRLHHELNGLYIARLVEVDRRTGSGARCNTWRAATPAGGAR